MGAAGGMSDPAKIQIIDLSRTKKDPLLAKVRRLLRQDYRFPKNADQAFWRFRASIQRSSYGILLLRVKSPFRNLKEMRQQA